MKLSIASAPVVRVVLLLVFLCPLIFTNVGVYNVSAQAENSIILPYSAKVQIIVNNAITNYCDGDFGLQSPETQTIFQNYNALRGETHVIGPFDANTELVFYIEPHSFCSGYRYLSTNTSHAHVHRIADGIWRIEWEDLPDNWPPDNDFDDLIVTIRLAGAYPDFKQNVGDWADDIYDHNSLPQDNIASLGCATTDVANLLAFYGARDVDPGTLNFWMIDSQNHGYDSNGGVIWPSIENFRPVGSNVGVIDWVRSISRDDPRIDFSDVISDSLGSGWPVILEYNMPSSPSGVHFIVATELTQTLSGSPEYIIKDPLERTDEITRISVEDQNILSARLYEPSDGIERPSLVIYGHSPIAILLIDSQGRRLGFDPSSGQIYWEIPDASYMYNSPFWVPGGRTSGGRVGESLSLDLPGALEGSYKLYVYGTGDGPFEIETNYRAAYNDPVGQVVSSTVGLGTTIAYEMQASGGGVNVDLGERLEMTASAYSFAPDEAGTISIRLTDDQNLPIPEHQVNFNATLGTLPASAQTDADGSITLDYQVGLDPGISIVTADAGEISSHLNIKVVPPLYLPLISR
jgi:hypothetical protein